MKTKLAILLIFITTAAFKALAIEGLALSIQSSNVVLTWPSVEGETYIVQYRASLDTNDIWQTLTNFYPATIGTNLTSFVDSNAVCVPVGGGGSGGTVSEGPPVPGSYSSFQSNAETAYPSLPPAPWDTDTWSSTSRNFSSATFNEESSSEEATTNGTGVCSGFYQVVRNGIFISGISSGTVGGQISFGVEVGLTNEESVSGFAIMSGGGDPVPGLETAPFENRKLSGTWNTSLTTNGTYTLVPIVQLGLETLVTGAVQTVEVHNDINFPTGFPLAGQAMRIEAHTIHTNGTWTMDFYDDTGYNGLSLSGDVDENGFCNYPGISGPGFSVGLTDENGNQIPSEYLLAAVTTTPNGGGAPLTGTNKIFLERAWDFKTKYVVSYMPIYQEDTQPGIDLFEMMATVVAQCRLRWDISVQDSVINALPDGTPFRLRFPGNWTQLAVDMKTKQDGVEIVRNFFYFGHGGPNHIGYTNLDQQISTPQLARMLWNNPYSKTNAQPFRFVFLDGCQTANGLFPEAFGIPHKTLSSAQFTAARGLRPRAFVGWPSLLLIGTSGTFSQSHKRFIENFYNAWPVIDSQGIPTTLRQALDRAAINPNTGGKFTDLDERAKVYGSPDLTFYEN